MSARPALVACDECRAKGEGARLTPWSLRILTAQGEVVGEWSQIACPHKQPRITAKADVEAEGFAASAAPQTTSESEGEG